MRQVKLWCRSGLAADELQIALESAGYAVERHWWSDTEPAVSDDLHFSRGFGNIYERYLSTPIRRPQLV